MQVLTWSLRKNRNPVNSTTFLETMDDGLHHQTIKSEQRCVLFLVSLVRLRLLLNEEQPANPHTYKALMAY